MLAVKTTYIDPTDETHVLIGPEGVVTVTPALGGDSFILSARNDGERIRAGTFLTSLLDMGLVPDGLPLNHRVNVALFGGNVFRDCAWVHHGQIEHPMTTQLAVID